jgi:hypothetical protein
MLHRCRLCRVGRSIPATDAGSLVRAGQVETCGGNGEVENLPGPPMQQATGASLPQSIREDILEKGADLRRVPAAELAG